MRFGFLIALLAVFLFCLPAPILALSSADAEAPQHPWSSLQWRLIGPANMGGRVTDIIGVPGNPRIFWVAGADGGIFKTTNAGVTFEPQFDNEIAFSVGALALAPSDQNVLWLGSGEGDPRNSVGYGRGVFRSVDGGSTWTHRGLTGTERIKRIVVDPRDPDHAYVCALGREWGPNDERGVFRTRDGGETWDKVLYLNEDTGCSDIAMDWSNPRILYAGMWTFRRRPWRFDDGGRDTALYRTMDGGGSWKKLTGGGLPDAPFARIGVSIAQSQPETLYMVTETPKDGTLFRSDDRGDTWRMVSAERNINFRPFYYSDIRVDPNNPDHIYSLSGGLFKSEDGGRNFQRIGRGVHGDHQSLWIDPKDSGRVLSGSDGGFQVSYDAGKTWDIINNVVLSQFYQIYVDDQQPYQVCGGLQDNGTWCGPSQTTHSEGIMKRDWYRITGGDGYYAIPVPGRPHEVYSNLQGGVIFFTDLKTGNTRTIHPYPKITGSAGDAIENHKYRFNWDSPILISPHDPNTVYFGGNVLFKTTDQGFNWEEISPDLTTNDKEKQRTSGGEIYQDNTAAEFHCTILTIAESPVEAGVIWVGTDDGNLQVTRDGGKNWTNVNKNLPGLPDFAWIAKIDASKTLKGGAYVAVDNHRSDDFKPYAYKTTDYGQTWTAVHSGLPQDDYVKVIREDPDNPQILYVGMEHGIQLSLDGGSSWSSLRNNLPPVSVRDIRVHPRDRDLIVGTHGRGAWVLDDITPIQQLAQTDNRSAHLFQPRPAIRWQIRSETASLGQRTFVADNPSYGASLHVFLRDAPEKVTNKDGKEWPGLTVTIRSQQGEVLRELKPSEVGAGINRVTWDLNRSGVGERSGPRVKPGTYVVTAQLGDWTANQEIDVQPDPRSSLAPSDYDAQEKASLDLLSLQREAEKIIGDGDRLVKQLKELQTTLKGDNIPAAAKEAAPRIEAALKAIQEFMDEDLRRPPPDMGYRQRPRLREELRSLMRAIDGTNAPPSGPQKLRLGELQKETADALKKYEVLVDEYIQSINRQLRELPRVVIG